MGSRPRQLRRAPDPSRSSAPSNASQHLPSELGGDRQNRIAFVTMLYAGFFTVAGLFMMVAERHSDRILLPGSGRNGVISDQELALLHRVPFDFIVGLGTIVAALIIFAIARSSRLPDERVCGLGMIVQLMGAFGIAFNEQWSAALLPSEGVFFGLSWVSFWIVMFPLVVPTTPHRAAKGAFLSASMVPLCYALTLAAGAEPRTPGEVVLMVFPQYLCAFSAVFASKFIYQLGSDASRARKLGSYELGDQLGEGGMGEVWCAQHELLKRPAAVKVIRHERLARPGGESPSTILRRFTREAKATAVLSSPHTVTIYDYGVTNDGTFYYVMELLRGRDLESLVKTTGPLPSERVAYLLSQVCLSLAEAHAHGLVHRDIKPANIFAARLGMEFDFVKVLDFGLVKAISDDGRHETRLTDDGIASGTPAYMAPEVASGDEEVGPAVDIYALGCVAYYLLTGRLVFESDNAMQMVVAHVRDEPVPPSRISELPVNPELEAIVLQMLAKDPADRPASAGALACKLSTLAFENEWGHKQAMGWWKKHAPELTADLEFATFDPPPLRLSA